MWTKWAIGSLAFAGQFVLLTQAFESLDGWLRAASLDVCPAFAQELHHLGLLGQLQEALIAGRVLNHQFGFPVDGQDYRLPALLHPGHELRRLAFEVTQRTNILGKIYHG